MNLEQMKARMKELVAKLNAFRNAQSLSDEECAEVAELTNEYNSLKNKIETAENLMSMDFEASAGRKTSPAANPSNTPDNKIDKNGGFVNSGEFFHAVYNSFAKDHNDPRFKNEMFEKRGEDGGFLVPDDFRSEIQKKVDGDQSLLARTRQIKTNSNTITLPISETAPWDNEGITAFWESEGAKLRESKAKFGLATWRLHKLSVLVPVSDELLEDAAALESWINLNAPEAILAKSNSAIIDGTGTGMPQGILRSSFTITVDKEVGQAADSVTYQNLVKMDARLLGDGIWIVHAGLKEKLRTIKDDNGNLIFLSGVNYANMSGKPFETLLGRPIVFMLGAMKQPGDRGDIILANLNYYITGLKASGIRSDVSTHVYFDRDMTAFRFIFRMAGMAPYKSPVEAENGDFKMSGFVTLQDRA